MSVQQIVFGGGGSLLIILTLIQISKIEINPWTFIGKALKTIGRAFGKVLNSAVIDELNTIKAEQQEMRKEQQETRVLLDGHIRMDDERNADLHRSYILRFNTELLRHIEHTEEDFNEILYNIDCYEQYCEDHPKYQNNRAIHAIKHIKKVYDDHLENGTFLKA